MKGIKQTTMQTLGAPAPPHRFQWHFHRVDLANDIRKTALNGTRRQTCYLLNGIEETTTQILYALVQPHRFQSDPLRVYLVNDSKEVTS